MAQKQEKVFNSFVKGLITEASPLTFPENASVDEQNFVLNRDGSRSRRLGVDYEAFGALTDTGYTAAQLQTGKQSFHKWESPGGDTTVSIGVIRIINNLYFLDLLTTNPSANLLNGGAPVTIGGLGSADIETTVINNKLVIVSSEIDNPVILTYNKGPQTVDLGSFSIQSRDIWGVVDGLGEEERPTTLSNTHKYNLRNQGWNENIVTADATYPDALVYHEFKTSAYPSNSDIWTLGKLSDTQSAEYEKYDPETLIKNSTSIFQTPKGSFIIDAFNRGASRMAKSDVSTGLPSDSEQGNISTVASYAQRLFFSGVTSNVSGPDAKSPNYSGYIYFSKTIQSDDDFGKCYQIADPTSPDISDLVDSDGGSIQIPEATKIVKIVASQSSLLVFAENGIWEIFGDTGGFIATSFQASKISTNGVSNPNSIVNVNGTFIYWSKAGIYILKTDAASGRFSAASISLTTIQSLFLNIPDLGKTHSTGFYDEKENTVRWLYNDTDGYSEENYINKYNKEIILDLTIEAWYVNVISDLAVDSPYVAAHIEIPGYAVSSTDVGIDAGVDPVLVTSLDAVIITEDLLVNRSSQFSFLTMVGTSFTLSRYSSTRFLDWYSKDTTGINYSSYLITGYELFKDVMRDKQVPYIFFYFTKTETGYSLVGDDLVLDDQSSCKVKAQWNWANSAAGGKWGNEFQAYRLNRFFTPVDVDDVNDTGDSVIVTKNKVRGSGKTISLLISSEEGKDMKLLGWALPVTATTIV
jgi:hypothetical protein